MFCNSSGYKSQCADPHSVLWNMTQSAAALLDSSSTLFTEAITSFTVLACTYLDEAEGGARCRQMICCGDTLKKQNEDEERDLKREIEGLVLPFFFRWAFLLRWPVTTSPLSQKHSFSISRKQVWHYLNQWIMHKAIMLTHINHEYLAEIQ